MLIIKNKPIKIKDRFIFLLTKLLLHNFSGNPCKQDPSYVVPREWFYSLQAEYNSSSDLDPSLTIPFNIFAENTDPQIPPYNFIAKTKNNFSLFYRMINLSYQYGKNDYIVQTGNGEKYHEFTQYRDSRFSQNTFEEFLDQYF